MNTISRRSIVLAAALSATATATSRAFAQDHGGHGEHGDSTPETFSCAIANGTPEVVLIESDIPLDLAYIDTMIPHHASVIALTEEAMDDLEDERLIAIAQAVLDTQPGEIEELQGYRDAWYPDATPADELDEDTMHEMMLLTMGGVESCGHQDHMDLMDSEWIVDEYKNADDKQLTYVSLVIPHHEMAVHQSRVLLEYAEHDEMKDLAERVIAAQTAEIEQLKEIRRDLMG